MSSFHWILLVVSAVEVILLALVFVFFFRLRRSENILTHLQDNQEKFLERLNFNTQLENELVSTFEKRQKELTELEHKLDLRVKELNKLIRHAEKFTKSPQFMKQIIVTGYQNGRSVEELARATGMSVDEVELIVEGYRGR
ncbi:hypothetical protein [Desulfonatronospira sp.]|uniref:hypothetical protein n=1 Tax=Desulfonatronospira sp. TaxID=1962951 RepID=UPI0025B99887|nr:hypothetical protein [Desulfonatronospira sp.]